MKIIGHRPATADFAAWAGLIAIGHSNGLFAASARADQCAVALMSLLHAANLNALDSYSYLKDELTRLPTRPSCRIDELLPHRWPPCQSS